MVFAGWPVKDVFQHSTCVVRLLCVNLTIYFHGSIFVFRELYHFVNSYTVYINERVESLTTKNYTPTKVPTRSVLIEI